jgi:prepilin-type N-terminal cleavage/methylation domain-containing protein
VLALHTTPCRSGEHGFSLVELLVAVTVLAVGLLAAVGTIDYSSRETVEAQRSEQALSVGQREIERLRSYAYADLRYQAQPAHGTEGNPAGDNFPNNPTNPNYYVQDGAPATFLIKSDFRNKQSATVATEELVETGGTIAAGPETFPVGLTSVKVWRYSTYRDEPRCTKAPCFGTTKDTKRITVAVMPATTTSGIGPTKPIYLSSVVVPPPTSGG